MTRDSKAESDRVFACKRLSAREGVAITISGLSARRVLDKEFGKILWDENRCLTHRCRCDVVPAAALQTITSLSQYDINPFNEVETCSESSLVGTRIKALVACRLSSSGAEFCLDILLSARLWIKASKHTHTFNAQNLLHDRYAISSCFSASCACASENIATFKGKGDRFGLDKGGSGKTWVC